MRIQMLCLRDARTKEFIDLQMSKKLNDVYYTLHPLQLLRPTTTMEQLRKWYPTIESHINNCNLIEVEVLIPD